MMRILEQEILEDLLVFYNMYLNKDNSAIEVAERLYNKHHSATSLVSEHTNRLIGKLMDFYINFGSGIEKMSDEDIKEAIVYANKRHKELAR